MSEVRNVQITGGAVDHYRKERGETRKRGRRVAEHKTEHKTEHKGGDSPPGASISTAANFTAARVIQSGLASGGSTQVKKIVKESVNAPPFTPPMKPSVVPIKASVDAAAPVVPTKAKLTLTPPKRTPKKLLLAPPAKKASGSSASTSASASASTSANAGSQRETKKIRVQLGGFKKRITRAKHISHSSKVKPIAEVRKALEDAKLIKPVKEGKDSVPEDMLRGIYKDYLLLRNRAL
jgi:hypothetical protein